MLRYTCSNYFVFCDPWRIDPFCCLPEGQPMTFYTFMYGDVLCKSFINFKLKCILLVNDIEYVRDCILDFVKVDNP